MTRIIKKNIYDFSHEEFEKEIISLDLKKFITTQIEDWIYKKFVSSFSEMTNLSKICHPILEKHFDLGLPIIHNSSISTDGTIKFLFKLNDGETIESVLIKEENRKTICVSSQIGCAYKCKFCITGKIGFIRNLKTSEIVGQIIQIIKQEKTITNIVFMGMGEPLANMEHVAKAIQILTYQRGLCISPRRITLSTCGLIPELLKFASLNLKVNLAISLNAAHDDKRSLIMPINKKYPLPDLIKTCHKLNLTKRQRIIFEYILIKDINNSQEDAMRLVKLLKGIPCKINLIAYNENEFVDFKSPTTESIEQFQQILIKNHFSCFIRKSKGQDISAACGQLKAIHNIKVSS